MRYPLNNFGLLATSSLVGIVWMASQCISKLEALTTQVDNLGVKLEENLGVKIGHVEENLGVKIGHLDVKIDNVEKALKTFETTLESLHSSAKTARSARTILAKLAKLANFEKLAKLALQAR